MANPGTYHGREGYITWASHWMEAWSEQHVEITGEPELIG